MAIATIFAQVSCNDIQTSVAWYEKLFGKPPLRRPTRSLAEWQFTENAEVQVFEAPQHAGHSTLTLGVLPLAPERQRLLDAGLLPGAIEEAADFFTMRISDPDGNLIVLASAARD